MAHYSFIIADKFKRIFYSLPHLFPSRVLALSFWLKEPISLLAIPGTPLTHLGPGTGQWAYQEDTPSFFLEEDQSIKKAVHFAVKYFFLQTFKSGFRGI